MASYPSQEQRPLKKPRLGPPDVYPQEPKQKEDELTSTSVKLGFGNPPPFSDEYGSAKNASISQEKFGAFFSAVMTKKIEQNTWGDSSKKKPQVMKENFWPVTAQKRTNMESWFRDLAAGSKPLSQLSRKVPSFNKKEEIFLNLCDFYVPMIKASWFIKMTAAHNVSMQENKQKKRQTVDQSLDWTQCLTKYMKEQLTKIQEYYHGSSTQMSFLTATQAPSQVDLDTAMKQWNYCSKLARHMYDEGLLDRHEFLCWIIDNVDKTKQVEDTICKMVLKELLMYLDEITLSAQISRRLAYIAARRISQLCSEAGCASPRTESPMLNGSGNTQHSQLTAIFAEFNNCPQHRAVMFTLGTCIQVITMTNPSALIWNNLTDGRSSSPYCGSPLDYLPCAPSCLPMPQGEQNPLIRAQIRAMEHQIRLRSRASEVRWSSDKCQQSTTGYTMGRMLSVLDTLDRHNFDKVESNNCLESLYNKIFNASQQKDSNEPLVSDEPIITLLIDWAVSVKRHGSHRAVVVAKLLEKRQIELRAEKYGDSDLADDKDSAGSDLMIPPGVPMFQNLLLSFLDNKAPMLDENPSEENYQAFANLIHLFSELIRHEVFSHDAYMCTLISRGEMMTAPIVVPHIMESIDIASLKSEVESVKHEHQDDIKVDMDIQMMETDLSSFFSSVNDDQRSPPAPASVKSTRSEKEPVVHSSVKQQDTQAPQEPKGPSRHMQYTSHLPLPQDELSSHECNQRLVVLFGVGKARDAARHIVKKVSREILRLFSRKNCIDVSSGDLGKNKKKRDKDEPSSVSLAANLEVLFSKFHKLSYYDQHMVTWQCTNAVSEQIASFTGGNCTYLPQVEYISYLFDLMEHSVDVNNLLEFSVQLLADLCIVESQLSQGGSSMSGIYTTSLCLCIVAIFRKYHSFLLVSEDLTFKAFEGLIGVVKHVCNPADCTSAERCILAYLYDVYTSCSYLKNKFQEMFSNAYSKIRVTLYAEIKPSASNQLWDLKFMRDFLENARSIPIEQYLMDQLTKNAGSRYSFVVNTMLFICDVNLPSERLNEISVLCAELTAKCNSLSAEWLGVLCALCCSSNHNCGYIDVLTQIDVSDLSIHDNLAVFTSILIARHCFSLQDLLYYVALPSLVNPAFGEIDPDAEPGARLTCHLLLRLFKVNQTVTWQYPSNPRRGTHVKASCDRHLLAARHNNIDVGAVLAVLKAMLVLSDSCRDEVKTKSSGRRDSKGGEEFMSWLTNMDDDTAMDMMLGPSGGMENAGLSEFSKHALRELCSQDWVSEKFLRDPEGLFNSEMLLDHKLSPEQTQQLVRMICYPAHDVSKLEEEEADHKEKIERILQTLDPWTIRVSLLELNLMLKQAKNNAETSAILDCISLGTVQLFHQQTEQHSRTTNNSQAAALLDTLSVASPKTENDESDNSVWLVPPLIAKLQSGVQGRVLQKAAHLLESSNTFLRSKQDLERNQKSKSLFSHQPFQSLILTCLKGQDDQREGLLSSILTQMDKFIASFASQLEKYPDEAKIRHNIHETLPLRLSLVGGMFDTIQRNIGLTTDWSQLLLNLIASGVVDMHSNYELFTTVLDMLNCLILGTLVPDPNEKSDDNRKTHANLVKKLKRELGEKSFEAIDQVRQLLPLSRRFYEVVTVEPHGTLVDTKGNKIQGFDSIKRKQGLQVGKIEFVSPWDVIESSKNPPPLSWTFFGAVKVEKKVLTYENQHRLLLYHTHSLQKSVNYFLDPPVLPPEELEAPPEKIQQEEKPVREPVKASVSVDSNKAKGSTKRTTKRTARATHPTSYTQPMPRPYTTGYNDSLYPPKPLPAASWAYPPSQPPAPYMPQPPMQQSELLNVQGPRYANPNFPQNSKEAIQSMLRARQPGSGPAYMPQTNINNIQQNKLLIRQRLVQQRMPQPHLADTGMYGGSMTGTSPGSGMMSMNQGAGPMNPIYSSNYGGMQSQPPMEQMMQQNFSQSYSSSQNTAMMQALPQQANYISQAQPTQVPFSNTSSGRIPMQAGGMNPPNTLNMATGNYSRMGQTVGQSVMGGPATNFVQRIPAAQQQQLQQQQLRQQQLLYQKQQLLQQQQQQQQQQPASQQAALMAQLRHGGNAPPQMNSNYNQNQYPNY